MSKTALHGTSRASGAPSTGPIDRTPVRAVIAGLLIAALAACGGGTTAPPPDQPFDDATVYSAAPDASLSSANEHTAVTHAALKLEGRTILYTATTGHLSARDAASGEARASMFYAAYTADGPKAPERPVTFIYNGGPGSASAWLHLGSFGPKRLAVKPPGTDTSSLFPLVDNAESLLDVTDLVFVDAVGTGYSQAIAPHTNRSFWGVNSDAAVFRDFVRRYLEVNRREASPKFLFGESYGAARSAVLALALEKAGVRLAGVVLQSAILDFNVDCGFLGARHASCSGYLPSYAAVASHYGRLVPTPADPDAFIDEVQAFADTTYEPAVLAYLGGQEQPDAALVAALAARTGAAADLWNGSFNLDPTTFRTQYAAGVLLGRYDARISVPADSPLARDGDPSLTFVVPSFDAAIRSTLRDQLRYTARSDYVMANPDIGVFDPRHNGRMLPDVVPDLAAVLALNPSLGILSMSGRHDLATPYHQTERDLKRLNNAPGLVLRDYDGGHMTYFDDAARAAQKADLRAFYARSISGGQ
ncbi:peptidase S10 [Piscinibacter sp. XHJ-5]|uniref:S10 family serine carboxypeptidase-like protein n=1 Tax=Piscinibacter sp. XHJ-5 TaxID=3037797 RepID=UPI002452DA03|nr:peptidase S10 [Piscinibacter sp. XHJ-5]